MTTKSTVLVVDDEPNIVELNRMYLENAGYRVVAARTGVEAIERLAREAPDLVVLDLMLPGIDGWEVCRQIRQAGRTPIIMLTARTEDVDRIVGLELGADDYVTKPYNPRELVARVRAVLRRTTPPADAPVNGAPKPVTLGNLAVDPARRTVTVAGETRTLRAREFDLLMCLLEHAGLVMSREQLLSIVWGYDYAGETRTVDVHVASIRRELQGSDCEIETVWGIGYKIVGPAAT